MKTIETVGKDIEKALAVGLAELGCKEDDVEVKILVHPGIFRKAKVRLTYVGEEKSTVEKKTAASVMRNVEERTRKAEAAKTPDNKSKQKFGQKQGQKPAQPAQPQQKPQPSDKPQRQDKQVAAQPAAQQKPAQSSDKPQRQDKQVAAQPAAQQKQSQQAKPQPKPQFTRDFRAELSEETVKLEKPKPEKSEAKSEKRETPLHTPEEIAEVREKAVAYLKEVAKRMGVETDCKCEVKDGDIDIELTASDEILIGQRGETIEALEYLTMLAANENESKYIHINLDAGNYRAHRNEMLVQNALAKADKAVATGKRVELEPMSSASRRVVHAALSERNDVVTHSEGKDPMRYIVIIPKNASGHAKGPNRRRYRGGKGKE